MNNKYINGVDGLRTLAVIMVLFYHLGIKFAVNGYLGVTIFFVVSGYFVARSLINELVRNTKIDVLGFYKKKITRLFPSVAVMSVATILVTAIFNRVLFTKSCKDILSSLLFYNNWWQIFNNVSYFERQGAPSPLTHCWSLGVEFQFYILFPLLLILLVQIDKKTKKHISEYIILAVSILSAALMWILFDPLKDVSRIYYGTDTRIFSLLLGAVLALYQERQYRENKENKFVISETLGIISFVIILYMMFIGSNNSEFMYKGGQFIFSLLVVFVLNAITDEKSYLSKVLSFKPFKYIGDLSYSIYLWHYPIIILISGGKKSPWYIMLIEICLTIALSYLTYRYIETPVRNGVISKTFNLATKKARSRSEKIEIHRAKKRFKYGVYAVSFVLVLTLSCIIFVPKKSAADDLENLEKQEEDVKKSIEEKKNSQDITTQDEEEKIDESQLSDDELLKLKSVMLVGDSVSLATYEDFVDAFSEESVFDAAVSRYPAEGYSRYEINVDEYGWDGDALVVALGTNGPFYDMFETLESNIPEDLDLFLVNNKAPYQEWESDNNSLINEFITSRPNTYLVDWYTEGYAHPEYFEEDETHLNKEYGAPAYIKCIKDAMINVYRKK